ncbi:MAG: acyl-CoA dehydratase activase [Gemmatimonadales bacterium]
MAARTGLVIGIDVGSTTVKLAVLDESGTLLAHRYLRANGRPREVLVDAARTLMRDEFPHSAILGVGITGSGGGPVADVIGGRHVNELVAQTRAAGEFHPDAQTIIEIGGQDSKFLSVAWNAESGRMALVDFSMNTLCAAGTGAFLDQQAERLGIAIEGEFATIAMQAEQAARVAGRCTVFAKSDMIHLQQRGTPLPAILAGLCLALARNFTVVIGKGKAFRAPILFQGGVASNRAVVRAFEDVLRLKPGELIVPKHHLIMAATGTALLALEELQDGTLPGFNGFDALTEAIRGGAHERKQLAPLTFDVSTLSLDGEHPPKPGERVRAWLGVDVGSVSTNVVLIDEADRVLASRYLPTAGKPLDAVRRGVVEVGRDVGDRVDVAAVGTTGSGRYLTADFVGSDVVRNEITAQARAALAHASDVDTIIEIGGQDSKYIRLHNGAVVDFAMNAACAAGTGSFLEEQADKLRINLKDEFAPLAFDSDAPACLGERCTVFMESDLVHHQQQGARVNDLTAGLAYSIAQNYLNRVVEGRPIGRRVLFQGGVAWNRSVVAAFRQLTGRDIRVPPHHDVTGAIGAAILAREDSVRRNADGNGNGKGDAAGNGHPATKFRGFDLADRTYEAEVFECRACPNLCEVNRISIAGEPPIFHGARCDKFEEAGRAARDLDRDIPDLFDLRQSLLLDGFQVSASRSKGHVRVAIPRALVFYDLFPYWREFLHALDVEVVTSPPTNPDIVRATQQHAAVETCFPVKLEFGHVAALLGADADFVFMPTILNLDDPGPGQSFNRYCPYITAVPHMVAAHPGFEGKGPRVLKPAIHMQWPDVRRRELRELAPLFHVSKRRIDEADEIGIAAQRKFHAAMRASGRHVLAQLDPANPATVIVGRSYNTNDLGANLDLPRKVRKLGVLPIPMDFLPLDDVDITDAFPTMFWRSGQDILAAARFIAGDPRLQAIYLTNFACGPDSFLLSFFRRLMGEKPFLEIEIDEHTGDAGVITRCEAFFDSLNLTAGSHA